MDTAFSLVLGELFTQVVYAHLILENADILNVPDNTIDQIFDFMVRDFSGFALQLHTNPSSTEQQAELCMSLIKRPAHDMKRFMSVWEEQVLTLREQTAAMQEPPLALF
mgnify:CR=1 FL=1